MTRTSRLQRALPRSSCLSRATRCSPSRLRRCVLAPRPYMQTSLHLILRESLAAVLQASPRMIVLACISVSVSSRGRPVRRSICKQCLIKCARQQAHALLHMPLDLYYLCVRSQVDWHPAECYVCIPSLHVRSGFPVVLWAHAP